LKPPQTYDEFIAAAKAISKPPDRYGLAMRGQTYSAIQVILPIWASAGVKFVDEKGNVDFDSPAAIGVTEKWVGLLTKDNAAQPTAVSDGYREQYALMEKGKCGMWYYGPHGSPALIKALGDNIQAVNNPRVGPNHYMLANPEGPLMTTSCKEKEAAWEFIKFIASGDALLLYTAKRMVPPVRKSFFNNPASRTTGSSRCRLADSNTWYMPPYYNKNWANFQDKIPPYWQERCAEDLRARLSRAGGEVPARPGMSDGRGLRACALAIVLLAWSAMAAAQGFPNRPVKVFVGSAAGGGADAFSRIVAQKLSEMWGQPVLVENKIGASASIAADFVAKSPPDGYNVVMGIPNSHTIGPHVLKFPYDVLRDFTPITLVMEVPHVLVVNQALPVKSMKELVDLAKANPGKLNYYSSGIGSTQHLAGEMFNLMAGIQVVHIPYKGSAPAIADVLGGTVTMGFDPTSATLGQIQAASSRCSRSPTRSGRRRCPTCPRPPKRATRGSRC
jgi:tripartite-type tricarboxylate transporter receptor subunit TctC